MLTIVREMNEIWSTSHMLGHHEGGNLIMALIDKSVRPMTCARQIIPILKEKNLLTTR